MDRNRRGRCMDRFERRGPRQQKIAQKGEMKEIVYKFGGRTKALRFSESGNLGVDPKSIELSERAKEIAREDKVSFGEALNRARSEMAGGVRFNETGGLRVDPRSVELNERAKTIARE